MSAHQTLFIEPLDVLFMRGNKLFGDAGSYGEALVPPWPSVAAGALRSRLLVADKVDLPAFARGDVTHPTMGTPTAPGSFHVVAFHLARRKNGKVEALMAMPADLVISEDNGKLSVNPLSPTAVPGVLSSSTTELLPVLAEHQRGKPASGYWLAESGWHKYLAGELPTASDLVKTTDLWQLDDRVGVGLDAATRAAEDGKLFSMQAVALHTDVGFLAVVAGADSIASGMLRLGGDGRAAAMQPVPYAVPEPDYTALARSGRCRLVLTTPGIFPSGSSLPGVTGDLFDLAGVKGRLVCAAVPRGDVVSGWDLARNIPKPAQRAVPAGAVYWLDQLVAAEEALRNLVDQGLWREPCEDPQRKVEGFNRISLALWL